mmetsp:Transcript_122106/g.352974  ORF Transcript_122106/g.352974 Transcript_122106/m.352974 type:complete len:234 (+) Transcript_122106:1552-2253(+)
MLGAVDIAGADADLYHRVVHRQEIRDARLHRPTEPRLGLLVRLRLALGPDEAHERLDRVAAIHGPLQPHLDAKGVRGRQAPLEEAVEATGVRRGRRRHRRHEDALGLAPSCLACVLGQQGIHNGMDAAPGDGNPGGQEVVHPPGGLHGMAGCEASLYDRVGSGRHIDTRASLGRHSAAQEVSEHLPRPGQVARLARPDDLVHLRRLEEAGRLVHRRLFEPWRGLAVGARPLLP